MKQRDGNYDVLTDVHTLHSPWGNTQLATRLLLRRALLMQEPVWQPGWSSVPDVIASGVSKAVVGECVLSRKHSRFARECYCDCGGELGKAVQNRLRTLGGSSVQVQRRKG